jgi:hypothetical protein
MKNKGLWPKKTVNWIEGRTLYVSIPFTWELLTVEQRLRQRSMEWDQAIVGGPAVRLVPGHFSTVPDVIEGGDYPGVLQMINPLATRTTLGCVRDCDFCGVRKLEGRFRELDDWPDLPIICDNNLLAASDRHLDRVVERLQDHNDVEFSFGLDCRLLTKLRAEKIATIKSIKKRGLRIALDSFDYAAKWVDAVDMLRGAGIAKRNLASFALIGFNSGPVEAWSRCEFIEENGIRALPVWFHTLDAFRKNSVTRNQEALGWTDYERRRIMQWFYQHKEAVKPKTRHPDPWAPKTRHEI